MLAYNNAGDLVFKDRDAAAIGFVVFSSDLVLKGGTWGYKKGSGHGLIKTRSSSWVTVKRTSDL